jgi:hypothetical protein
VLFPGMRDRQDASSQVIRKETEKVRGGRWLLSPIALYYW